MAGYCTSNDFSARDLQLELDGHQWMIGKTLDDFAPIGPYFVCADLVEDPNKLNIECRVNGETRQHSNTSSLVYNTEFLVSYISRHFPLEPGDLIFTGTPPGRNPRHAQRAAGVAQGRRSDRLLGRQSRRVAFHARLRRFIALQPGRRAS
jgi:2-keto-4-pentenoate hydratase/2-oxohepta-3-ene-1,7-dioic acid hydratase in catechol pathway